MAKYRAMAALYVGSRLIAPGEGFTSDAVPGAQWEPLDDEGRAAHDDRHAKPKPARTAAAAKPAPGKKSADKKDA